MLFASRARTTGPFFLIGWLTGITLVVTVVLFVPGLGGDAGDAIRQWMSRPPPGAETTMPKWMAGVDTMGGGGAFGCGIRDLHESSGLVFDFAGCRQDSVGLGGLCNPSSPIEIRNLA